MKQRRSTDTVHLIEEALALESAGGTWNQSHVAAITGYSPATIRVSDCPKHYELTPGSTSRPRLVYVPAEVRRWKSGLLRAVG